MYCDLRLKRALKVRSTSNKCQDAGKRALRLIDCRELKHMVGLSWGVFVKWWVSWFCNGLFEFKALAFFK